MVTCSIKWVNSKQPDGKMSTRKFDQAAAGWDGKSRRVEVASKISAAIANLPLHKKINGMEYGCGTGLVGLALAPTLGHLTVIDTSQGMLDVVREKIESQNISNVTAQCCDLLRDNYTQKHDLIFSAMTLHHIKDTQGLLQRFTALLNPGGYLALADLVTEDGSFHGPDAEGIMHHGFDPHKLADLLTDSGMTDIKSEIIHSIDKEENNKEYPVFLLTGRKA
ncbi:MAG TPA: class I SAM-dependent methyltransferase [Desulfobacterales bacterium]|nr:class I SAM-dependent methyltransferase [Desulfobacterales bacterium]